MNKVKHFLSAQALLPVLLFLLSCGQNSQKKTPNMVLEREIFLGDLLYEDMRINNITDEGVYTFTRRKQLLCFHTEDTIKYCIDVRKYTNGRIVNGCSFSDTCNFMLDVLNYPDGLNGRGTIFDDRTYINFILSRNCKSREYIIDDFSGHQDALYISPGLRGFSDKYIALDRIPQEIDYSKVDKVTIFELRDFEGNVVNKITEDPKKINYKIFHTFCEGGVYFVKVSENTSITRHEGFDTVYKMNAQGITPLFYRPMKPYKISWIAYCPETKSIALLYIILDEKSEHYNKKVVLIYNVEKKTYYYFPVRRDLVFLPFQIHKRKLYFHKYNHENNTIGLYTHTIRNQ